jgi:hypothetical protein
MFDRVPKSADDPSEQQFAAHRKISGYATNAITAARVAKQRISGQIARIFDRTGDFIPVTSVIE